ncbi:hypothetical protein IC582_002235 [Cucumis melo]
MSIGVDQVSFHHCDVRDEKQVEETVTYTIEKHGHLDILVSNAGTAEKPSSILELDMSNVDNVFSTNVRGVLATIKHAGGAMVKQEIRGSIICMGSTTSVLSLYTSLAAYTSSKHAVLGDGEVELWGARDVWNKGELRVTARAGNAAGLPEFVYGRE